MENDVKQDQSAVSTDEQLESSTVDSNKDANLSHSENDLFGDLFAEMDNPKKESEGDKNPKSEQEEAEGGQGQENSSEKSENNSEDEYKNEEKEDAPYRRAEERKLQLNREIRESVAELKRIKAEVAEYAEMKLPSREEIVDFLMTKDPEISEAEAFAEADRHLLRAEAERSRQIDSIAELRQENLMAVRSASMDFPELFDQKHPAFNRELANGILEVFETTAGVIRAGDGEIVSANAELYPYLAKFGEAYRAGVEAGKKVALAEAKKTKTVPKPKSSSLYPSSGEISGDADETEAFLKSIPLD